MSVKTITITEDAYTKLAALKEPGESFSEVVQRIAGRASVLDLAGALSPRAADEIEKAIRASRKRMHARTRRVIGEFQ